MSTLGLLLLALLLGGIVRAMHLKWRKWTLDSGPSRFGQVGPR